MHTVDIIAKKRDGQTLTDDEIRFFIEHYTRGDIPDYQAAALLMAVLLRGMTPEETVALTLGMAHSGEVLDLSDVVEYAVDKHSSGGVGDKTSLVVLPLVAACGVTVAKMSGRGLGYSGGTLDKLESLRGYNVNLSQGDFKRLARENGIVLAGQSLDLAPADGKLYALRDVTATVPSLPLIVSSIMSKKIAAGAQGIVLDVKAGSGAFMPTVEAARELAQAMVDIGDRVGRDMIACVSDMNQPLGDAVGNALEVKEAIETLRGGGPSDFREHCITVAQKMLLLAGQGTHWADETDTRALLEDALTNGAAFTKFRLMVEAQGGDVRMVDDPSLMPQASIIETLTAPHDGYIARFDALGIAKAAFELGAGREKKGDMLDLAVGVVTRGNVGDAVKVGDVLVTFHANDAERLTRARQLAQDALTIQAEPVEALPLFYGFINGQRVTSR